ncbi:hypothetical protein M6B38_404700 [Iris pallida]|uniref:Uncharacterized protein n=1 Tax=Iris pallida TaxID=29817 RepID=A0AAX6DU02_IRIPA|nr:hypothetical protein M6B38_229135 [Iris pallida]KAJ6818986.1 hypothetical protein M6B38_404700 [Iris pallida]
MLCRVRPWEAVLDTGSVGVMYRVSAFFRKLLHISDCEFVFNLNNRCLGPIQKVGQATVES